MDGAWTCALSLIGRRRRTPVSEGDLFRMKNVFTYREHVLEKKKTSCLFGGIHKWSSIFYSFHPYDAHMWSLVPNNRWSHASNYNIHYTRYCIEFHILLEITQCYNFFIVYSLTLLVRHSFIRHPQYYNTFLRDQNF
jgi:hypothetical protein